MPGVTGLPVWVEFVMVPSFYRSAAGMLSESDLRELELMLVENPREGAVVGDTGGVRKVRLALPGRGKRGSVRVSHLYVEERQKIYLLLCYPKNEQENITPEQKRRIRELVAVLKGEEN